MVAASMWTSASERTDTEERTKPPASLAPSQENLCLDGFRNNATAKLPTITATISNHLWCAAAQAAVPTALELGEVGTESSRSNRPRTSERHPRVQSCLRSRRLRSAARPCCSAVIFRVWSNQDERSTTVRQIREISCTSAGLSSMPACAHVTNSSTMCVAVRRTRPLSLRTREHDQIVLDARLWRWSLHAIAFTSTGAPSRGSTADADGKRGLRCGIEVSFSPASGCSHRPRPCSRGSSAWLGCPSALRLSEDLGFSAGSPLVNTGGSPVFSSDFGVFTLCAAIRF